MVRGRRRGERVREEQFGEFALAEGNNGRGLQGVGVVGLHLHALAEIHEGLVDFACFGESGACCFCCAGAFGAYGC